MIAKLLSASLLTVITLGANAYNVDDYVYTKTAKYQVAGANLVTNGDFKLGDTGTDGWLATDDVTAPLTATFTMATGGPNGSNTQKVLAGQTALTAGMKQQVAITQGGTYVVTFRVMGTSAGFSDIDLSGANTNYMNVYYNTDGALATAGGTNNTTLSFGEGGVNGGHGFSFTNEGFTEVSFAVDAPAEGFIMIDFRGLNEGLEIADVECHRADKVYDSRIADRRLAYIKKYLDSVNMTEREMYGDLKDAMDAVQDGIDKNVAATDMESLMENMEGMWTEFISLNFGNYIDYIPTKDGSASTGNNSSNWYYWTTKWNKLSSDYKGKAPWSWSTDRWCHKATAVGSPMNIQWMRGSSGNWDNIATLTTTLDKGTYFFGVSGDGGMMTLNKNRWARSYAKDCADTQIFFNGDTTDVFRLDPSVTNDYVYKYDVTEDNTTLTLGIRCNTSMAPTDGFDVAFYSPVLYKLLEDGELTPEQKAYLEAVSVQLDALKGRIDVANAYLSADQKDLPWGKEDLQIGTTEAQNRYDGWAAMTQGEILDKLDNAEVLADTIMTYGVRYINNDYITPFVAKNVPLTSMPAAIAAATATRDMRIYGSSTKMADLTAKIVEAQAMYDTKLVAAFSSEDSLALVDEKAALEALVVEFKNAISLTNVVDIDFGTQEAPAAFVTHEATDDADAYYTVAGNKGTMKFSDITGSTSYLLGYNNADSLGMLRVGNSKATVDFTGVPVKGSDIVNVKFDYYFGSLSGKNAGFYVMTEAGDTLCGLYICRYNGTANYNPWNIEHGKITSVGSSSASNAAIAAASNKTSFDLVFDYGAKVMYCVMTGAKGTYTTAEIPMQTKAAPAKFMIASDYNNADRRCWFDNLEVNNIAAEPTDAKGVDAVENASQNENAIYNIAGQKIAAPAKGQIYITNGAKFVK